MERAHSGSERARDGRRGQGKQRMTASSMLRKVRQEGENGEEAGRDAGALFCKGKF